MNTSHTGRTFRRVLAGLAVLLVMATACSGGDDGDQDAAAADTVIARVGDRQITETQIADLLADPAYRAYAQLSGETGGSGDGEQVRAPEDERTTLAILIQEYAIEAELDRRGLAPTEEQLAEARALLVPEADAASGTTVKPVHEPFSDETQERVANDLARYRLLDAGLRGVDPDDPELRREILERAPSIADRFCGPLIVVPVAEEVKLRQQIQAGTPLESMRDRDVTVLLQTEGPEERCILVAETPDQLVNLVETLDEGEIGIGPGRLSDGTNVVYATQYESRERVEGADAAAAARTVLESLRENGYAAYQRLLYLALDPEIDPDWGRWVPQFGLFPPDGALPFEAVAAPPTTTSTAPPTTAPPTTAPAPSPPATGAGGAAGQFDPGPGDLQARAEAALVAGVPAAWREAVPVRLGVIGGATSLSYSDGRLDMGAAHLSGPWDRLVAIISHEFGHHIAFRYGTQASLGAAPAGWPSSGSPPVERWADCVARCFTAYPLGSHGMTACENPSYAWTQGFVGSGPGSHPRTG